MSEDESNNNKQVGLNEAVFSVSRLHNVSWLKRADLFLHARHCEELQHETDPQKMRTIVLKLLHQINLRDEQEQESAKKSQQMEETALLRHETKIQKQAQLRDAAKFETEPLKVDQEYKKLLVTARTQAGFSTQQAFASALNEGPLAQLVEQ